MKIVTAVKKHTYDQTVRNPGESYSARERDIVLLEKLGYVAAESSKPIVKKPIPPKYPIRRREYKRRDLEAEE